MLGKLLKYEFKATGRTFIPLYMAIIVVSILSGLVLDPFNNATNMGILRIIPVLVLVGLYVALGVLTLMVTVQRFNKNLLGDEGYLMFTLPVSSKQLILSKMITSVTWYIASGIVSMISFVIIIFSMMAKSGELAKVEFNRIVNEFFALLSNIGSSGVALDIINVIVFIILSLGVSVLLIYVSIAIGQLSIFSKHRTLMAFVAFFAISIVMSMIGNVFLSINHNVFSSVPMQYLSTIVTGLIAFFATTFILDKKLNLE